MNLEEMKRRTTKREAWIGREALRTLRERGEEPALQAARAKLLEDADAWLTAKPFTVLDKKHMPPSRDKHDYMSLSVYNWPNPDTPDGLPYVTRDGLVNPEVEEYDRPSMARMVSAVEALSLAYGLTGDERYASKAAGLVDAWFLDPATRMNPHLLYAQYIPGNGGFDRMERYPAVYVPGVEGEGIYVAFGGVIESTVFIPFLNVVPLLEPSPSWDARKAEGLRAWFRTYLHWLLEHQHGKDEAGCLNNHGSWYCNQIVTYALFSGEEEIARSFLTERVPARIAMQIRPDGSQPEELVRAIAFHYVVFGLLSFFNCAAQAAELGIDLWRYETAEGSGLRRGLDWLVHHLDRLDEWPYKSVKPLEESLPDVAPLLSMAFEAYGDPAYAAALERLPAYPFDHRYRLLFPARA
ncbi:alginate lyase family protein [Paenibacillus sp.]|uniref:alginate lyase family protein n=1 Tax=Paenibacillus sp. TaxID=58172 RepID=UPI002D5A9E73|nr:alginate lyase family protein [Paenibacillus sp.]HZG58890.1 alginate lyase family protein [Paenibacillus sp.]